MKSAEFGSMDTLPTNRAPTAPEIWTGTSDDYTIPVGEIIDRSLWPGFLTTLGPSEVRRLSPGNYLLMWTGGMFGNYRVAFVTIDERNTPTLVANDALSWDRIYLKLWVGVLDHP